MRKIFVIALCVVLFVSTIECKKVANEKNEKNEKKRSVEKEQSTKGSKTEKVKVAEVHVPAPVQEVHVVSEPEVVHIVEHAPEPEKKIVIKPKTLKVLTEYDLCKMECRKARDNIHAKEYVEQLRQELATAEAQLREVEAAKAHAHDNALTDAHAAQSHNSDAAATHEHAQQV